MYNVSGGGSVYNTFRDGAHLEKRRGISTGSWSNICNSSFDSSTLYLVPRPPSSRACTDAHILGKSTLILKGPGTVPGLGGSGAGGSSWGSTSGGSSVGAGGTGTASVSTGVSAGLEVAPAGCFSLHG